MVYNIDEYTSQSGIGMEDAQRLLDMLTMSVKEFKETNFNSIMNRWDFNYFRQKPLIRLGKVFYPIDSQLVLENMWDGTYWKIIDGLSSEAAAKFRTYFGRVFELYCHDLLISVAPSLKKAKYIPEFQYGQSKLLSPDAFIHYGDDLIVIDFKAKRMKMQATLVEGNLEAFEEDVFQMILETVRKIYTHIKRLRERQYDNFPINFSKVKRYYGVVVTQGSLSGVKSIYEKIERKLREAGYYNEIPNIQWHILDINEFEAVISLLEQGVNLANTFVQKSAQRYRYLSFHDYLAYAKRPFRHSLIAKERFMNWLDYVIALLKKNES